MKLLQETETLTRYKSNLSDKRKAQRTPKEQGRGVCLSEPLKQTRDTESERKPGYMATWHRGLQEVSAEFWSEEQHKDRAQGGLFRTDQHTLQKWCLGGEHTTPFLAPCRTASAPHLRVAGADAEAAHKQLCGFFQHVPNFTLPFLHQLLICLTIEK